VVLVGAFGAIVQRPHQVRHGALPIFSGHCA
jgi:hypothetical protein